MTDTCEPLTCCEPSADYTPTDANYTLPDGSAEFVPSQPDVPTYTYTFDYYEPVSEPYTLAEAGRDLARNTAVAIMAPVALLGSAGNGGCRGDPAANPSLTYGEDAAPPIPEDASFPSSDSSRMSPDLGGPMSVDGGEETNDRLDGGTVSAIVPSAEVLQIGSGGFLLRGIVLSPDGVIDPGEVLIIGNEIVCAADDCSSEDGYDDATWIDTHGIISPGLIDSHNHVAYNFLPEWVPTPPTLFNNRYEWADNPAYEAHIAPYADNRSSNATFCPAAKWGELRALVHGTTTMQEQPSASGSCIDGTVRDPNRYHGLGYDFMGANIGSVRDINDSQADDLLEDFSRDDEPITRYHVHMAEGVSENHIDEEFASYAGRDPRTNRHNGTSLLGPQSILIHSLALTDGELVEAANAEAKIVWSPSSNMALYGAAADINRILELGITTGIGPDWTVSGEDDMPSEMRYALAYARGEIPGSVESPLVTPERLWQMATSEGAVVLDLDGTRPGLEGRIGRLEAGYRADVSVFAVDGPDPYEALINSRSADVRLVMIDGAGYYGEAVLEDATARNDYCEDFDACGTPKFICVQDSPTAGNRRDETLADIEGQLTDILAGYGREDDLLPLINCGK